MGNRENNRADKLLKQQRVDQVVDLMTIGLTTRQIIKYIDNEKYHSLWGDVGIRQKHTYVKLARAFILEKTDKDSEFAIRQGIRRYNDLYAKLYQVQDYKGCLLAQEKKEKLLQIGSGNDRPVINNNIINVPLEKSEITDKLIDSLVYPDEN